MATTRMRRRPGPLAALLAAEVVSTTGSQMTLLALPWFVLVTTGSPARMGVVVAADLLPMVVLAIPGGAVAGRLGDRRRLTRASALRGHDPGHARAPAQVDGEPGAGQVVGQGGRDLGGLWREEYGGDLDDGEAERRGVGVELDRSMRDGCIVVALTGPINLFTAPRIQRALLKDLAERPYGIVCDLTAVDSIDPVCAAVFSAVANHPSSDWPATSFLLCGARPGVAKVLERVAVPNFLPLYTTVEEALDKVAARPPYLRDELSLAPTATAPAAARLYVHDVLQYWRLALPDHDVIDRAELLADELVTNAVVHARTPLRLRLELRGDLLHIAVHDGSPRLLRLVPHDPEGETGRGLRLVETLASAWGVYRRPDHGKVVWCSLRLWRHPAAGPASGPQPDHQDRSLRRRPAGAPAAPRRRSRPWAR